MARPVPPLNPLHVFEVASRVGSFTKAAEILSVTPSAVSRQIATLESFLGLRLFHRGRDGNTLTEVGAEYYAEVAPAFEIITQATERVTHRHDKKPLNVRVPSTFAVQFLIPRLPQFRAEHPGISIRIVTGFGPVDFVRDDVDISLQVGSGEWPGSLAKPLFPNWVQPMCSPRLLQGKHKLRSIDDLLHYRLLYSRNRPGDWHDWVTAVGRPDFPLDRADMIELPNSMLANQAAADGVGIVIGQMPLLGTDFASHPLIPLFGEPVRQGSYYAVWRAGTEPSRKARQFLSWLQRKLEPLVGPPPAERDAAPAPRGRAKTAAATHRPAPRRASRH